MVGAFTFVKIWQTKQQENKKFGLIVTGGIAGYGASMVGAGLSKWIWNTSSCGYYTYGNIRAYSFFLVMGGICTSYMLIFSVSYLETGLKMVFL
jgi:hypothetical protein